MRRLARRLTWLLTFRGGNPSRPVLVALVLALSPVAASAELPPSERPAEQPWFNQLTTDQQGAWCGGFTVFAGDGGPLPALALLRAGQQLDVWSFFDPTYVHPIPKDYLARIEDGKILTDDVTSREQDAYFLMLVQANRTAPEAFDQAAKENSAVGFAQLYQEPAVHHGQVVYLEGRLKRVRRYDTVPPNAWAGGVRNYYEGWLLLPNDHHAWIVFTELPPGLEVKDEMDVPAGFSGYFFKKVSYAPKKAANESAEDAKAKKPLYAPELIGRSPSLLAAPPAPEEPAAPPPAVPSEWVGPVTTLVLVVLGGVVAFLFLVGYWLRRSDARVRARVNAVRYGELVLPPPAAPPLAVPVPPTAPPHNRIREGPGRLPEPGSG
jgi:hypothetical protein